MIDGLLYRITARLPVRIITAGGRAYLERYYVGRIFGADIYLHRFLDGYRDQHLHNHPWGWGCAIVLAGGYVEDIAVDLTDATPNGCLVETRRVRWWNRVDGNRFHRIANVRPGTWTLFIHGPRVQVRRGCASVPKGWGFITSGQAVGRTGTLFMPVKPQRPVEWWHDAPIGSKSLRKGVDA